MPWHGDLGVPAEELDQLKMDLHNGGWRVEWEKDEKRPPPPTRRARYGGP